MSSLKKAVKKAYHKITGKKYAKICDIDISKAETGDLYPSTDSIKGKITEKQRECLSRLQSIKDKKISELTPEELSQNKKDLKKITKSLQIIEEPNGRGKHSGIALSDPFSLNRMEKKEVSIVPRSDGSEDMFAPKISIDEPTIEEILATDGKAYIDWRAEILSLKHGFKGGKSRKMNRKSRRQRKTRRY
jgi:hypothetical protein